MAKHYVFGYGSLICAESRAVTASALKGGAGCDAAAPAIPVRLRNWIRLWNVRGQKNTFLGVVQRFHPAGGKGSEEIDNNNTCVGVLVPLPSSNNDDCEVLFALDRREKCYDRHRVDLSDIERVDNVLLDADDVVVVDQNKQQRKQEEIEERYYTNTFLRRRPRPRPRQQLVDCDTNNDDNSNNNKQDEYNSNNENENENKEIYVWIYVPRKCYTSMASNTKHPILQSYVDIALRGCLSISKLFAKEFVDGTYGWYPGHQYNDDVLVSSSISSDSNKTKHINDDNNNNNNNNNNKNNNKDNKYCCWINDRHNPLYVRSDKEFSLKHSDMLDACLVLSSNDSKPTSLLSYRIDSRCDSK
jgi:cation transport regulator ChaC